MRRELGQLPSQPISNFKNDPPIYQPPRSNHQSNDPPKNFQFKNDKEISELQSRKILKDPYQDQVKKATDASQNENLKEEISTEINPIKESEPETDTDLSEKNKEPSVLEVDSSTLESSLLSEQKLPLITSEHSCLESNDTLSVSSALNLTPNLKTQFMSILKE